MDTVVVWEKIIGRARQGGVVGLTRHAVVRVYDEALLRAWPDRHILPETNKTENLSVLSGIGDGGACVILGSGPSARGFDVSRCTGVPIFALNGAYRLLDAQGARAQYGILSDAAALREYGHLMAGFCDQMLVAEPATLASGVDLDGALLFQYWKRPEMARGFFQTRLDEPLYHAGSVVHFALQIAVGMGFSNIGLVGIDLVTSPDMQYAYTPSKEERLRSATIFSPNVARIVSGLSAAKIVIEGMPSAPFVFRNLAEGSPNPFSAYTWDGFWSHIHGRDSIF